MALWVWFLVVITAIVVFLLGFLIYIVCTEDDGDYEPLLDGGGRAVPRDFLNDEESLRHLAEEYDFTLLLPEEQQGYLQGQEFTHHHPPKFDIRGRSFGNYEEAQIKDMGVHAWLFENELGQEDASEDTPLLGVVRDPSFVVRDKTELVFRCGQPYRVATAVMNMAMPCRHRVYLDAVYFETKVFEYTPGPNTHFAIGLVTKPYPQFRLPGYNNFLIAYESTGNLKINKPFPTPLQQHQGNDSQFNNLVLPPLQQADVVGFGYVVSLGTIFITRNGKRVMDVMKGCYLDLYPAVGCFSADATFQVNIGKLGFVWIEANVRKYGFVSTTDSRRLSGERGAAALPRYSLDDNIDRLLDKGEELPPEYPSGELDFFGRTNPVEGGSKEKITTTQITNEPEEVMDLRERLYEQETNNFGSTPRQVDEMISPKTVPNTGTFTPGPFSPVESSSTVVLPEVVVEEVPEPSEEGKSKNTSYKNGDESILRHQPLVEEFTGSEPAEPVEPTVEEESSIQEPIVEEPVDGPTVGPTENEPSGDNQSPGAPVYDDQLVVEASDDDPSPVVDPTAVEEPLVVDPEVTEPTESLVAVSEQNEEANGHKLLVQHKKKSKKKKKKTKKHH